MPEECFLDDLPSVGDLVVFCGTELCLVEAVDSVTHILTIRVMKGNYISFVYAEDVHRFDNKKEIME